MTELTIHGSPNSTFLRTARLAAEEKGVAYTLKPVGNNTIQDLKSPEHVSLHPFGRIPVMQHDGFTLYESTAIARYIDEAFDGPALQPADVKERALMNQWLSATADYLVPDMLWGFVIQFAAPPGVEPNPDLERVEASRPKIRSHCEVLDRHLEGRTYLAGDGPSIADFLLTPILHYVGNMPGGMASFEGLKNLERWWYAVSERSSFKTTKPPMLEQAAAAAE